MALTNTLSALTREKFMPILVDNIFNSNALCLKLLKNAEKLDGGSKIVTPVEYATNSNTGFLSYASSGGVLDLNEGQPNTITGSGRTAQDITDIARRAEWNWATAYSAVLINGEEIKMNEGSNKVLSIMKARMSNAEKSIRDVFGTGLFASTKVTNGLTTLNGAGTYDGGQTSTNAKLWDNLSHGGYINDYSSTTGTGLFLPESGNDSASGIDCDGAIIGFDRKLGGIDTDGGPTTNTYWNANLDSFVWTVGHTTGTDTALNNDGSDDFQYLTFDHFTSTTNGVAKGVKAMTQMYGACTVDADQPDLIVTTQTIFDAYETALQANKRFEGDATLADAGFSTLRFKGASVVVDSHCPAGHMYFLNTKYLDFKVHSKRNFEFENFRNLEANDVMQSRIFWMGQLICTNPSRQGLLVGGPVGY